MAYNNISTIPASTQQMIVSAVNKWNTDNPNSPQIDPVVMLSIASQESNGNINSPPNHNTNGTTDYGLFQLNSGSFPDAATLNPSDNTTKAVAYYGQNLKAFGGDNTLAIASYNAGVGHVKNSLADGEGIPNPGYVSGVLAASNGRVTPTSNASGAPDIKDLDRQPTAAIPLNNEISQGDYYALAPSLFPDIVVKDGLSGITPWYQDTGLLTGNPNLRKQVQPVTFRVILGDNINTFTLSSGGRTGTPVEIQLNASMKSYSVASKHMTHTQRTRTAFHITMWGMQADIIEGQCTTGVFMNQFGLTDYFSTFDVDEKLKQLVVSGLTLNNNPSAPISPSGQSAVLGEGGITGGVVSAYQTVGSDTDYQTRINQIKTNTTSAFRVAAQDAFQEFLSLFKMNGAVWFYNKAYQDGIGTTRQWDGIQAWSPELGINSAQENARNNDVMTRGTIQMQFRNFVYEGYFKTLTWTMDANNPFKWDFSFTFQVERTIGTEFVPTQ